MRSASYLVLTLCFAAAAQTPSQPAQPAPANGLLSPAYTLKTGTQLVILDVVVRDKKGRPVHGLKPGDFLVKESGGVQQIRSVDEHTALTVGQLEAVPRHPQLAPGEFTNLVTTAQTGALNIILYDVNNTSIKDQAFMRQQLIDYLKHARPDSRTAVFVLTTRLILLQGFTSDPAVLLAAFAQANGKLQQSLQRDATDGGLQLPPTSGMFANAVKQDLLALGATLTQANLQDNSAAIVQTYQEEQRNYNTLDGLNDLARTLVTLPGRKNLIWFAGDFPPNFFPSENNYDGAYSTTAALDDEFRDTVNLLARAQVAVYPIDAQGLRSDQANNATKQNSAYATGGPATDTSYQVSTNGNGAHSAVVGSFEQVDHGKEFALVSSEHQAMEQIAHDTGGKAFYNHSDLTRMVSEAIDDGSNYYTLSYTPSGAGNKDGLRTITVNIAGTDYKLSYRHGYYTDRSQRIAAARGTSLTPKAPLLRALAPGSPQPTQILLRARAFPTSDEYLDHVASGNNADPDPRINHGPYRLYQVDTAASILGMNLAHGADDTYSTKLDFVINVFDIAGHLVNSQSNTIKASYRGAGKLAEAKRSGIHFGQQISVPAKGDYFVRVAVHDATSGHVGAIEFPVASIADLEPPVAAAANAPPPAPATAHP